MRRGVVAAAIVFGLAAAQVYGELFWRGATRVVPVTEDRSEYAAAVGPVSRDDVVYEAWLVSRNARTLATAPHRLFDAPHCAPLERSLTLGIPMATLGALAIPGYWSTGDPVLGYNLMLVALSLVGATAMYLLVASWTGEAAAGIVAGLAYGFHVVRLREIVHPSVWDATWVVFALFFAERLFARGRWRDALGLGLAIAAQVGAGYYALLSAVLLSLPFGIWLLLRDRLRQATPARLAVPLGLGLGAVVWLFGPYLATRSRDASMVRDEFWFAPLSSYLPGGDMFSGLAVCALALVALVARREALGLRIAGDPRPALLAGASLAALVAAGSGLAPFPDLHALLRSFVPGLDAVRVAERLGQAVFVAIALLAGLGTAALVRASGSRAFPVAAAIAAAVFLDTVRAPWLGLDRSHAWSYEGATPRPEVVEFFAELERRGDRGPLFEIPITRWARRQDVMRIAAESHHGRRTSACYGSYLGPERRRLIDLAGALPAQEAVDALADRGFATLVHHADGSRPSRRLEAALRVAPSLAPIHRSGNLSAYRLRRGEAAASDDD